MEAPTWIELAAPAGTLLGAAVAGIAASPHCVLMCGPLGCAVVGGRGAPAWASYHGARVVAYGVAGALAGGLGGAALGLVGHPGLHLLPWLLPVFLLALAFRLDKQLPAIPFLARLSSIAGRHARKVPAPLAPAALGLATPLLPCGPLYLFLALTLASGSASRGLLHGAAFAAGTIPLLLVGQLGFARWRSSLNPRVLGIVQSAVAIVAAGIAVLRLADPGGVFCQ